MQDRQRRMCLAAVAVALACAFARPQQSPDATHPFTGVTYVDRTQDRPRAIHLHAVQIDLGAPGIRFHLSPHAGRQEVVRQTTLEFLRQEHAQVAINAHFFYPWPTTEPESAILGIGASDGDVYSAFERPEQRYALLPNAPGVNIDRSNHASIVHIDPAADGKHVREGVPLWNTVAGSAQIVTSGVVTLPVYAEGAASDEQLTPGGPNGYSNANSWYEAINARTAIGLSRDDRTVTLFTVDVRGGSLGMSVHEVADLLVRDFGVWNALNLDGGGSTSMAMEDPVTHASSLVNSSSDNPNGRAVGSSLAVFAERIR